MQSTLQTLQVLLTGTLLWGSLATWIVILLRLSRRQPLVAFERPRNVVPWNGADAMLVLLVMLLLPSMVIGGLQAAGLSDGGVTNAISVAATGGALLFGWFVSFAYLRFKTGASLRDLGFSLERPWHDVGLGLAGFLAALLPVYIIQFFFVLVLKFESRHPLITLMHESPALAVLAAVAVTAAGVAPLVEEFSFRVVLQGWLEKQDVTRRKARKAATEATATAAFEPAAEAIAEPAADNAEIRPTIGPLIVVSVIFGLLHFGHGPDPVALFVFSLFLGYLYRQTHRILAPLVVHMALNGLTVLELCFEFAAAK